MDPIDEVSRDYRAYLARRCGSETGSAIMETLSEFCRRIIAACEFVALDAIQSGNDRKADRFISVAEGYTDILSALESEDGERVAEMIQ